MPFRYTWEKAIRAARLGTTATSVALVLATYANADGTSVHPGDRLVAEGLAVSLSTVERATKRLRDEGWLKKVSDRNHRAGLANEYRLTLPNRIAPVLDDATARSTDRPADVGDRPSSATDRPSLVQGSPGTAEVPPTHYQPIPTTTRPARRPPAATQVGGGWARAAELAKRAGDSVAAQVTETPSPLTRPSQVETAAP